MEVVVESRQVVLVVILTPERVRENNLAVIVQRVVLLLPKIPASTLARFKQITGILIATLRTHVILGLGIQESCIDRLRFGPRQSATSLLDA